MKKIPIEFLPRFWVSQPEGIEGKGSGFILAENIYSIYSIEYNFPKTNNLSIINISDNEINKQNYLEAVIRIITENWLDNYSLIIIGNEKQIKKILINFLIRIGGIQQENAIKIINSKLG